MAPKRARGWSAFYNHLRWNPASWLDMIWKKHLGRTQGMTSESHATFMPDVAQRFPIVLGREFCGEIIDVAPDLMYTFPVGSKVVGYMKPWQQGALSEALFVPVSQCAHLPANLSGSVRNQFSALHFFAHTLQPMARK